jgi:signal peptidase II
VRHLQERRVVVKALTGLRLVNRHQLLIPAVAAAVVLADQSTKTWALHHAVYRRHVIGPAYLWLTYNSGTAFSLGQGIGPIVEAVVVVLVVSLLVVSRRLSRSASVPASIGMGLLLGGALSNLADRLFRHLPGHPGSVVDFVQAVSWWPVFNLADASIVTGVILLALVYSGRKPAHE